MKMSGAVISTFAYFSFYSRTSKSIVVCSSHSLMMCSIEMVLLACCVVSKGFIAKVTVILFAHYQPRNAYTISKACEVVWLYKVFRSLCGHCFFDLYLFRILKWFIPRRPSRFSSCKNPFSCPHVYLRFQLKYYVILNLIIILVFLSAQGRAFRFSPENKWFIPEKRWPHIVGYSFVLDLFCFLVSISRRSWSLWVRCGKMVVHKE